MSLNINISPFCSRIFLKKKIGSRTPPGQNQFLEKKQRLSTLKQCWFIDGPASAIIRIYVSCLMLYDIDPALYSMLRNTRNYILFS